MDPDLYIAGEERLIPLCNRHRPDTAGRKKNFLDRLTN
jgi:hypothetical protein